MDSRQGSPQVMSQPFLTQFFSYLILLTIIYLFSLFTLLLWLYLAIWCPSNMPRTVSLQDSLTWLFPLPGMIFDQIYFALSFYLRLHEDKSFLHRLTSNLEIQEHPQNTPSPSLPSFSHRTSFFLNILHIYLKFFICLPYKGKKKAFHEHMDFFHHFISMLRTMFDMQ